MDSELKQTISELVEQPLLEAGFEVAELVLSKYKGSVTLKFFVYSAEGVGLDECRQVSRLIGEVIEGTDLLGNGYLLDVSSPGLDRPLTTLRDYRFRIGETVRLKFVDDPKRKVVAEIISVDGDQIEFRNDEGTLVVPFNELEKAMIIF